MTLPPIADDIAAVIARGERDRLRIRLGDAPVRGVDALLVRLAARVTRLAIVRGVVAL